MLALSIQNFDDWRTKARHCLQRGVHPDQIQWLSDLEPESLFSMPDTELSCAPVIKQPCLDKRFFTLANEVCCFNSQAQWTHLYRIAYALVFEDKRRLEDPLDADMRILQTMRKKISRDKHKMKAFVRFKQVAQITPPEHGVSEHFVAWFEPDHFILADMAPFFCKRFHNMNWSIFTPYASLHWKDKHLFYKEQNYAPLNLEDATETLWLTYYRHIFNPARLKLKAMQSEMPKKYWKNLPEAVLIDELTRSAHHKTGHMIKNGGVELRQKPQNAKQLKAQQYQLRKQAGEGLGFDP